MQTELCALSFRLGEKTPGVVRRCFESLSYRSVLQEQLPLIASAILFVHSRRIDFMLFLPVIWVGQNSVPITAGRRLKRTTSIGIFIGALATSKLGTGSVACHTSASTTFPKHGAPISWLTSSLLVCLELVQAHHNKRSPCSIYQSHVK
jgi:hypothetical protein